MLIIILTLILKLQIPQLKHPALILVIIITIKWQNNNRSFHFHLVLNIFIVFSLHIFYHLFLLLQCLFISILSFHFEFFRCLDIHDLFQPFDQNRIVFDIRTIHHHIHYSLYFLLVHYFFIFYSNKLLFQTIISNNIGYDLLLQP